MNKELILREELAVQRTRLANQSTFLAFLRTSMYFLVAGLSLNSLLQGIAIGVFVVILFVGSALLLVVGIANYFFQADKIKKSETLIGRPEMASSER